MVTSTRFREGFVDADGFHIRYMEGGEGPTTVVLHGAGGPSITRADELLAEQYRLICFEMPGFGSSAPNERTKSAQDLARTMSQAGTQLGLERYNVVGTSFGGRIAVWMALDYPDQVDALVLVAPAAVIPEGWTIPSGPPNVMEPLLFAHPERRINAGPPDPAVMQKQQQFIARIRGLERDPVIEERLPDIQSATLVLFGTRDGVIPPEAGRVYREKVPNCHYVLVYDAAHAIASDRPEALSSTVADFLERREVFVVSRQSTLINP